MSKSLGNRFSNSKGTKIMEGAYLKEGIISNATDKSGQEIFGKVFELALEIEIPVEGQDWTKKATITGNIKDGKNLGGAFPIIELFDTVGTPEQFSETELDEMHDMLLKGKVPLALLSAIKGKSLIYIEHKYAAGKWAIYRRFNTDKDKLIEQFKKDLTNGYVKIFLEDDTTNTNTGETSFNYGNNASGSEETI